MAASKVKNTQKEGVPSAQNALSGTLTMKNALLRKFRKVATMRSHQRPKKEC
jgi:hypothetical protein